MPVDLEFAAKAVARAGRKAGRGDPDSQALQEHYGYLPEEALRHVCERATSRLRAITGVASFYDMFRFQPTGKHVTRLSRDGFVMWRGPNG